MFYFKRIVSYFDYYEYGEKKKSCGYGKVLVKDREVTIEIHIKGLDVRESRMCDIHAVGTRKSQLGRLFLDKGTGCYNACFHGGDMDGNGLRIFDVAGLYIGVDEDKYCKTVWEWGKLPESYPEVKDRNTQSAPVFAEARSAEPEAAAPEKKPAAGKEETAAGVEAAERELAAETGAAERESAAGVEAPERESAARVEAPERESAVKMEAPEKYASEQRTPKGEASAEPSGQEEAFLHKAQLPGRIFMRQEGADQGEGMLQERLHEDKWTQLRSLYPVCHPFADNEEYISIAPKDFVVLRKEYQNLVSNSFLLHSFYNYHHVILGKMGNKDDDDYYIGVPGAYLEREKRVAVMFGFEGFAQSERGNGSRGGHTAGGRGIPCVEEGAFGYYMRKVEI